MEKRLGFKTRRLFLSSYMTPNTEEKVKPCPFCGEQPIYLNYDHKEFVELHCGFHDHSMWTKEWQDAYCWKLLDEKERETQELVEVLNIFNKFTNWDMWENYYIEKIESVLLKHSAKGNQMKKEENNLDGCPICRWNCDHSLGINKLLDEKKFQIDEIERLNYKDRVELQEQINIRDEQLFHNKNEIRMQREEIDELVEILNQALVLYLGSNQSEDLWGAWMDKFHESVEIVLAKYYPAKGNRMEHSDNEGTEL